MPDAPEQALVALDGDIPRVTNLGEAMQLAMTRARQIDDPDPDPYGYLQDIQDEYPEAALVDAQWTANRGDPRWNKRVRARARKAAVAAEFLMGKPVGAIAQQLRVSEGTVYRDLQILAREWRSSHMADIEALAGQDLARLDFLMQKLAPAIERGDVQAVKAALDIVKERASILGYRQGVQVDMEEYIRAAAETAGFDPTEAVTIARRVSVSFRG